MRATHRPIATGVRATGSAPREISLSAARRSVAFSRSAGGTDVHVMRLAPSPVDAVEKGGDTVGPGGDLVEPIGDTGDEAGNAVPLGGQGREVLKNEAEGLFQLAPLLVVDWRRCHAFAPLRNIHHERRPMPAFPGSAGGVSLSFNLSTTRSSRTVRSRVAVSPGPGYHTDS